MSDPTTTAHLAENLIAACIEWCNDDGTCHFCAFEDHEGRGSGTSIPHDDTCPVKRLLDAGYTHELPGRVVALGPELFSFASKQEWINKARGWYRTTGYRDREVVTLDAAGRICIGGGDFTRAEEEGTYPIRAYPIDPKGVPNEGVAVAGAQAELAARHHENTFGPLLEKDS